VNRLFVNSDVLGAITTILSKRCLSIEAEQIDLLRDNRKITEKVGYFTNKNRKIEPTLKITQK